MKTELEVQVKTHYASLFTYVSPTCIISTSGKKSCYFQFSEKLNMEGIKHQKKEKRGLVLKPGGGKFR